MRKYIFSVLIALLSLPVIAQQQQSQAKAVLDKTAEAFRKAGGVKADFIIKSVTNGLVEGAESGTIQLKGEKFVLKASEVITWFDGKTQWSYVVRNEHSKNFEKVKKYYDNGIWNEARVYNAVGKWITKEEYKEITGEDYK